MEINKIYQGDCLEIMKTFPDKSVDLVLTDPPYGIGLKYDVYDDSEDNWFKMFDKLIPEIKRISKMSILPCCRIKALEWIYKNHPPDWLICWYKGSPGHRSFIGFNDWEPLLVYGKNEGVQMHDYFQQNNIEEMGGNGHPCPKSVKWAEWLIDRASQKGQIILDPFLGSGTTAVAAKKLGRNYIGIEISEKYAKMAEERVNSVTTPLFVL